MPGGFSPRILRLCVAIVSLLACASAHAAEPANVRKAQELYNRALALFDAGDVKDARWPFALSYTLDPATGSLIHFAECDEKLGLLASAWTLYREAAREAEANRETDRAQIARAFADQIEPLLPRLTIVMAPSSRGGGVEVLLDGRPVEADAGVPVDPGDHEVEAHGEGVLPWAERVHVEPKEKVSVRVSPLVPRSRAPSPWGPAAWVAASAGVVALSVGAAYGFAGLVNRGTYSSNKNCVGGTADCNPTGLDAANRAQSDFRVADISYGIGCGLLVAAGAFWWASRAHDRRQEPSRTGIVVVPMVSADSWMLSLNRVW